MSVLAFYYSQIVFFRAKPSYSSQTFLFCFFFFFFSLSLSGTALCTNSSLLQFTHQPYHKENQIHLKSSDKRLLLLKFFYLFFFFLIIILHIRCPWSVDWIQTSQFKISVLQNRSKFLLLRWPNFKAIFQIKQFNFLFD